MSLNPNNELSIARALALLKESKQRARRTPQPGNGFMMVSVDGRLERMRFRPTTVGCFVKSSAGTRRYVPSDDNVVAYKAPGYI